MIDIYAVAGLIVRVILALMLWKTGKEAFSSRTRTLGNSIELTCAIGIFLGFFIYPFTTIILIRLGIRIWKHRRWVGPDTIPFLLTLFLFLNGSGAISIDKLLGNI